MENQVVSLPGKLLSGVLIVLLIDIVLYVGWMNYAFPVNEQSVPYWLYRSAVDDSGLFCIGIMPLGVLIAALTCPDFYDGGKMTKNKPAGI